MSETAFMLGLFASSGIMLGVVARSWMRPHPGGRVEFSLGPSASGRALGVSLAAFVVAFGVLAGLAVGAAGVFGHDGPLYVAFLLPWVVPVIFQAARWGLESGAPGKFVWENGAIVVTWGTSTRSVSGVLQGEHFVHTPAGRASWVATFGDNENPLLLAFPLEGEWAAAWAQTVADAGVPQTHALDPRAIPVVADFGNIKSFRATLRGER